MSTLQPIVISGPSGAGKSTMLKRVMKEYPGIFGLSVSHTTRKPRQGETDGVEYHFVSREDMEAGIANGDFVEHAEFGGNIYGTSKRAIKDVAAENKLCVLDIEKQGCESIRNLPDFDPLFVFIKPPSLEELGRRLKERGTETEESFKRRMATAQEAIEYGDTEGKFHHVIENTDLETAYKAFLEALMPQIEKAQKLQAAQAGQSA